MSLDNNPITARAHTNIALVKYWGKKDEKLIIPNNSSISLTLDEFYTETTVNFDDNLHQDTMYLDNKKVDSIKSITNFMDIVRNLSNINNFAKIISYNHVPTSAGLASSASGFAALAAAASKAAGLNLNDKELSKLARRGSGSATRSIYGGFAEWKKGTNDKNSYAVSIQNPVKMDINMIAIILDNQPKKISSRKGMKISVNTSPYYTAWEKQTTKDLETVKDAIYNNDFTALGKTAELNSMRMHSLTLSSDPSYLYLNKDSLLVINHIKALRDKGIECYYTMDAGPNVKIICQSKNIKKIKSELLQSFDEEKIKISKPGEGIKYL
ncbi:diphosphomevalonate decarboxylase [Apilactobacillus micheneri]|uniref:diphosphomevalonate decarboxylase n=1 Tax=Apilactobacillus micheneri TaxID=1899430 RepID=A0A2S2JLC8_9LACO|nr:diphosphomevalonate decarboxylase [Apilactobacillus micheneri]TPR40609.1 diphosphomevalonate decarboxylase [Apilactobacillus micheneri]TPR42076.1 diphosphomevalonate decarboxylase [Apilactobacillus micheneri]TPR44731.1 diphosphomevalonate decarboxylase [Apilactobacillus micheneri]TPR45030.1 diphosphomevalonate decarboxylase [Apilactobacillus micheneri]TPR46372.1 diphosphomevalonate decarboxylase [Apilactobacillus micheneri]